MTERDTFTMAEEFADVDFNEERLEKRFRKTMETLAKDPRKSIYGSSANRAEAKAIYNLLGNDKFNKEEILRSHRAATIRRMEGHPLILAVQDTRSVNYDSRQKLVLGVLDQMGFIRA
jgi:hypothetical protein